MKILYDHQIFSSQVIGGISRYHVELIKHLTCQWELPVKFSNNTYLPEIQPCRTLLPTWKFRGKNRLLEHLNRRTVIAALQRGNFDIFHPTFYDDYALDYLGSKPLIFMVHDLIHDRLKLPASNWEIAHKKKMAQAARHIIVPSQFTASELMELYQIPGARITVVPHGAPEKIAWQAPHFPQRFLFVGGRNFYKNFPVVLQALQQTPEAELQCIGLPFSKAEQQILQDSGLQHRVFQRQVGSDAELLRTYRDHAALIFSSRQEGFGLPILEAFAAGCPVLLADTPVFHEVAGEAGQYFAPDQPQELASLMCQTIQNRDTSHIASRLAQFSWTKCAQATQAVYAQNLS